MTISLTPEMEASIERQLNSGHYRTSQEVMARALSALELYELAPYGDPAMRSELADRFGHEEAEEFVEGEVFVAELDAWMKDRLRQSKG